jgi:hypothetical protein
MCIRVLEIVALQICKRAMISWFPQNIHAILNSRSGNSSNITADHLPKYNLGFFFRSRRNNNSIWHFTSSELR